MDNYDVESLREWAPLTDLLEKVPARIQKGIFSQNLNITSVAAVPEFIALGTDAGIVFWYNRASGEIQKLRNEGTSPITCLRVVSSVEYMVAAGNSSGQVNVFQIQKELPPDLNLAAPLTKTKPIERYTIRDLHRGPVTCCEWSKNGMKLFSGDKQGVVVLTEFDYQAHLSKSVEILNEAYDIVQLSLSQQYLLVSTTFRSIICLREKNGQWQVSQVGKKDRKVLSDFGGTFCPASPTSTTKTPTVICSRPGLRFWIADCSGNVQQTLLFKEAITRMPVWEIPLLNPSKGISKPLQNFGKVFMYSKNFIITYDEGRLFVLNLDKLRVEAITQIMRGISDVAICGKEIFVLEGPRSLIRLSSAPEPPNKTTKIIFNPLLPPPVPSRSLFELPFEFEAEEEAVINAEECFELPPIQHIDLDIPIQAKPESPTSKQNKLLMEQSRRIEVFDRINEMEYEDSILYRSGANRRHKKDPSSSKGHSSKKKKAKSGIVEIGQAMDETPSSSSSCDKTSGESNKKSNMKLEVTTRPLQMDASFCTDTCLLPDPRSPDTLKRVLEPKERALAACLNLEPVKLVEITKEDLQKSVLAANENSSLPVLQYPIKYPISSGVDDAQVQTTPRKKLHFINDEPDSPKSAKPAGVVKDTDDETTLSRDMKNVMIQSDCTTSMSPMKSTERDKLTKSLQFTATSPTLDASTSYQREEIPRPEGNLAVEDIPDVQSMPEYMNIPSIWNVRIERVDDTNEQSETHISGDWEIVDN